MPRTQGTLEPDHLSGGLPLFLLFLGNFLLLPALPQGPAHPQHAKVGTALTAKPHQGPLASLWWGCSHVGAAAGPPIHGQRRQGHMIQDSISQKGLWAGDLMVYPKSLGHLQSKSLSSPPRLAWPHLTPGELPLLEVFL